ncbi:site-specific integrase [uncultured Desulfosarcina sp.]|uniref:site-specific integrase n=1 Tax=uncultured Desulfosarcina sp. TaxID=218289 RepID=UPI0029C74675|nr:site-specific integrase [uncultured Desulfosarcina sp.]
MSTTRSPSYLLQTPQTGCFYFRMRVPLDLQPYIGKKELRASLKTGYLADAKSKSMLIAGRMHQLFRRIRGGYSNDMSELDQSKINAIIRGFIKDSLDEEEEVRINRQRPLTEEEIDQRASFLGSLEADSREALAKSDFRPAENITDETIQQQGLDIEKGSTDYRTLSRELMKAQIAVLEVEQKRVYGWYDSPQEASLLESYDLNPRSGEKQGHRSGFEQPQQPRQTSATMKQAGKDFWNEYNHGWKPRSRTDYKNVIEQIVKGLGPNTQLHTVDYNRVKEFRQGLRDGSLTKYGKPLSIARVNFIMATVQRIFDLAMKQDKDLDRINPADGLQLRDKRKVSEKRDVFTKEDLQKLFVDSKEYGRNRHTKAPNFWVPLLGLYTGARMEELCQLLIEDIVKRDGVWCIDIRDDNAERKSVKTGERRIVPLHPFLVEDLRFPEYVHNIPESKGKRIFHELKYVNNRWGHGFGQWFSRFKQRAGIDAPAGMKSFHSFRHTLINQLKQSGADPQYVKEFVGHQTGKDITWGLYGKSFQPAKLMEKVVSKLNYPIDLSHLKASKWVPTSRKAGE